MIQGISSCLYSEIDAPYSGVLFASTYVPLEFSILHFLTLYVNF